MRTPRLLVAAGLVTSVLIASCGQGSPAPIVQPMHFNHAKHAAEDLACLDCHMQADKGQYATTLTVDGCFKCHEEVKEDEHADIKILRETREQGHELPWQQVNRLVGHVYFSHEAHVTFGEMACADCHGAIDKTEVALTTSQVTGLDMATCMACHEDRGADNSCIVCHK